VIDAPGSTREIRRQLKESGFRTKAAAEHAEAERRITEQQKYELEKAGLPDVPLPTTLGDLLRDFFAEHAEKKLAKKTIERYREQAAYLHLDLLRDAGLRNKTAASCEGVESLVGIRRPLPHIGIAAPSCRKDRA
jgi:hypothetical protein